MDINALAKLFARAFFMGRRLGCHAGCQMATLVARCPQGLPLA